MCSVFLNISWLNKEEIKFEREFIGFENVML